jgi:membrane carboxypeptidase/penicillin-binding protein
VTYRKDGTEYLDSREKRIHDAVRRLNGKHRTTNSSQVAAESGYSPGIVTNICSHLKARGFLTDVSKGAAYHWRVTDKPAITERAS